MGEPQRAWLKHYLSCLSPKHYPRVRGRVLEDRVQLGAGLVVHHGGRSGGAPRWGWRRARRTT
jgi:hypothetical protein